MAVEETKVEPNAASTGRAPWALRLAVVLAAIVAAFAIGLVVASRATLAAREQAADGRALERGLTRKSSPPFVAALKQLEAGEDRAKVLASLRAAMPDLNRAEVTDKPWVEKAVGDVTITYTDGESVTVGCVASSEVHTPRGQEYLEIQFDATEPIEPVTTYLYRIAFTNDR